MSRVPALLTVAVDDEDALLTVANWFRGFAWERLLVATAAIWHLAFALVLVSIGSDQAISSAAGAAFTLLPRGAWIILFAFTGVSAGLLVLRVTVPRQLCTWLPLGALGLGWLAAFSLSLSRGDGSWMGLVGLFLFLCLWGIAAVRIGRGKR